MSSNYEPAAILLAIPIFGAIMAALIAYSVLAYGFVISQLWAWFIVPLFGLPALGLVEAYGVALVASLIVSHIPKGDADGKWWASVLLRPWIVLAVGWVLTLVS